MDINYSTLPEEELRAIINSAGDELQKRREEKKYKLIEAFKNAWKDLEKFGIEICYDETIDSDSVLSSNCIYFD